LLTLLCANTYADTLAASRMPETKPAATEPVVQEPEPQPEPEPKPEPEPEPEPEPQLNPEAVEATTLDYWKVTWEIIEHGEIVDTYQRQEPIFFGEADTYTTQEGVVTFRGNHYRSEAAFGTASVTDKTLTAAWDRNIGSLNNWTGSGWTGQPLIVRWDEETKAAMDLYADKKEKTDLVEVIYATLDGYVYFYDLDDGSSTRDPLFLGMNFKGAGSLDPRGYPILYVGSGDFYNQAPRMYIVSLLDNTILHEISGADEFAHRGWYAFDSAPLVHGETDTLIWPGESGLLYTIKLNTQYDPANGILTVAPEETVKARYTTEQGRALGFESSCLAVGQYLFIGDNGGMFFCIDLNTMTPVWVQSIQDDINATPVFEWGEDENGYIYIASSMEYAAGTSYIYKLNANTGEIIWEKAYSDILYDKAVSGGVLSSPILGRKGTALEGLVIYSVSKTPNAWEGILVALDTDSGEVVWETTLSNYCWSSPVPVYTESGDAYVVICDSVGTARLIDGTNGEVLTTVSLGSNIEASPAVFENMFVIGTRGQRIYGIEIK